MLLGSVDFKQKISSDHTNKQQGRKVSMFQQRNREEQNSFPQPQSYNNTQSSKNFSYQILKLSSIQSLFVFLAFWVFFLR